MEFFSSYVIGNQNPLESLVNFKQQDKYNSLCPPDLYNRFTRVLIPRYSFNIKNNDYSENTIAC